MSVVNVLYDLYANGRYDEVVAACHNIPDSEHTGETINLWTASLQQQDDFKTALELYSKYSTVQYPILLYNHARALVSTNQLNAAVAQMERAIELDPEYALAHISLATLQFQLNGPDQRHEIGAHLLKGFSLDASQLQQCLALCSDFETSEHVDIAEAFYRGALHINQDAELYSRLINLLESQNRLTEAVQLVDAAVKIAPDDPKILMCEAVLAARLGRLQECLGHIGSLSRNGQLPAHLVMRKEYLLGEVLDKLTCYDDAFDAFTRANEAYRALYENIHYAPGRFLARLRVLRDTFASTNIGRDVLDGSKTDSACLPPIAFIVGFPRSGTTLLEIILRGNEGIHVLDEKPFIGKFVESLGGTVEESLEALKTISGAALAAAREQYLSHIPKENRSNLIVDKLPLNVVEVPFILRLFPQAKFLFALRHPCDSILSCFMQNFYPNDAMANMTSIDEAVQLYDEVMQLWTVYQQQLSPAVKIVKYEALVTSLAETVRETCQFLGTEFAPGMLDFCVSARRQSRISTPSYKQVVLPLYTHSIARWEAYRRHFSSNAVSKLTRWGQALGYDYPGPGHPAETFSKPALLHCSKN